jgi:hypothetical protein
MRARLTKIQGDIFALNVPFGDAPLQPLKEVLRMAFHQELD